MTLSQAEGDFVKGIVGEDMYSVHFSGADYQTRHGAPRRSKLAHKDGRGTNDLRQSMPPNSIDDCVAVRGLVPGACKTGISRRVLP